MEARGSDVEVMEGGRVDINYPRPNHGMAAANS